MTASAEPLPCLTDACRPPDVIGMAALTTAAMHGAGPDVLEAMIGRLDADPAARFHDMAIARQLAFRRAEGLDLLDAALARTHLFRTRRSGPGEAPLRVLALVAPGVLMANVPLDFITNHLDVRLDLLFVLPDRPLPDRVPDHDVAFFAAGDPDGDTLARLKRLFAAWPRPVLNDPRFLPLLARDRLSQLLAGLPGLCSAPAVAASRAQLEAVARAGNAIGGLLPGGGYPVLLRPFGSQAGHGLKKIDSARDLATHLMFSFDRSYYVTRFVDYRSADGLFRKYRVAFIERQPYLCHMAVSENWMVHYLNAGMTDSADKRAFEEQAMATFDGTFARRHASAFEALHQRLPFDYYSIDCGELPDGRLVVFEADTAAIIHLMDPVEMFPYKHAQMRRVFDAFGVMLRRRASRAGTAQSAMPAGA